MLKKVTSIILCLSFLINTNNVFAFKYAKTNNHNFIPTKYGKVIDSFKGLSDKKIYVIADLHCNPKVQKNISKIIETIQTKNKINKIFIGVEGNNGKLNTKFLNSIPNGKFKNKFINYLLNNGYISGWELYSIYNPEKINLLGLEDKQIYLQNFKSLYKSLNYKNMVNDLHTKMKDILRFGKMKAYPIYLNEFEYFENKYKNGKINIFEWIKILQHYSKKYGVEINTKENIRQVIQFNRITENISEIKLITEIEKLTYEIKNKIVESKGASEQIFNSEEYLKKLQLFVNNELTNTTQINPINIEDIKELDKKISSENYISENENKLNEISKYMERFYDLAEKRNEIMVDNLDKNMSDKIGIMIVGGYHINGITEILRGKGISYEVIIPNVAQTKQNKNIYETRLKEQGQWLGLNNIENINLVKTINPQYLALMQASDDKLLDKLIEFMHPNQIKEIQTLAKDVIYRNTNILSLFFTQHDSNVIKELINSLLMTLDPDQLTEIFQHQSNPIMRFFISQHDPDTVKYFIKLLNDKLNKDQLTTILKSEIKNSVFSMNMSMLFFFAQKDPITIIEFLNILQKLDHNQLAEILQQQALPENNNLVTYFFIHQKDSNTIQYFIKLLHDKLTKNELIKILQQKNNYHMNASLSFFRYEKDTNTILEFFKLLQKLDSQELDKTLKQYDPINNSIFMFFHNQTHQDAIEEFKKLLIQHNIHLENIISDNINILNPELVDLTQQILNQFPSKPKTNITLLPEKKLIFEIIKYPNEIQILITISWLKKIKKFLQQYPKINLKDLLNKNSSEYKQFTEFCERKNKLLLDPSLRITFDINYLLTTEETNSTNSVSTIKSAQEYSAIKELSSKYEQSIKNVLSFFKEKCKKIKLKYIYLLNNFSTTVDKTTAGQYYIENKYIEIGSDLSDWYKLLFHLFHEITHSLQYTNRDELKNDWEQIINKDISKPSEYSMTLWDEDMAESVSAFFTDPLLLEKSCPNRFEYLCKYFNYTRDEIIQKVKNYYLKKGITLSWALKNTNITLIDYFKTKYKIKGNHVLDLISLYRNANRFFNFVILNDYFIDNDNNYEKDYDKLDINKQFYLSCRGNNKNEKITNYIQYIKNKTYIYGEKPKLILLGIKIFGKDFTEKILNDDIIFSDIFSFPCLDPDPDKLDIIDYILKIYNNYDKEFQKKVDLIRNNIISIDWHSFTGLSRENKQYIIKNILPNLTIDKESDISSRNISSLFIHEKDNIIIKEVLNYLKTLHNTKIVKILQQLNNDYQCNTAITFIITQNDPSTIMEFLQLLQKLNSEQLAELLLQQDTNGNNALIRFFKFQKDSNVIKKFLDLLSTLDSNQLAEILQQQNEDGQNSVMLFFFIQKDPNTVKYFIKLLNDKLNKEQLNTILKQQEKDTLLNTSMIFLDHQQQTEETGIIAFLNLLKKIDPDKLAEILKQKDKLEQTTVIRVFSNQKYPEVVKEFINLLKKLMPSQLTAILIQQRCTDNVDNVMMFVKNQTNQEVIKEFITLLKNHITRDELAKTLKQQNKNTWNTIMLFFLNQKDLEVVKEFIDLLRTLESNQLSEILKLQDKDGQNSVMLFFYFQKNPNTVKYFIKLLNDKLNKDQLATLMEQQIKTNLCNIPIIVFRNQKEQNVIITFLDLLQKIDLNKLVEIFKQNNIDDENALTIFFAYKKNPDIVKEFTKLLKKLSSIQVIISINHNTNIIQLLKDKNCIDDKLQIRKEITSLQLNGELNSEEEEKLKKIEGRIIYSKETTNTDTNIRYFEKYITGFTMEATLDKLPDNLGEIANYTTEIEFTGESNVPVSVMLDLDKHFSKKVFTKFAKDLNIPNIAKEIKLEQAFEKIINEIILQKNGSQDLTFENLKTIFDAV
jgi:hypothetical protein